jgi:hypothetical protein
MNAGQRLLWAAAVAVWAALLAWPFVRQGVLVADDVALLRAHLEPRQFFHPWGAALFRPVESVGSLLLNPDSRSAAPMILLHVPALVAVLAALRYTLARVTPLAQVALPVALLWLAANIATTVSLWQPDTLNQTWSAAAGLALLCLLHTGLVRARSGSLGIGHAVAVAGLSLVAVAAKELGYGWCLGGIGLVVTLLAMDRERPTATRLRDGLLLAGPVVVVAAGFALARLLTGGLADLVVAEPAYEPQVGANLVRNAVLTVAGLSSLGPTHTVTDGAAPLIVRLLPLAGSALTLLLIAWPFLARRMSPPLRPGLLAGFGLLALSGVVVAIPMDQISEHYVFGPNVITAGIVGVTVAHAVRGAPSRWLNATLLAAVLVGAIGLAARAWHFDVTWAHVRAMDAAVTAQLDTTDSDVRILVPEPYFDGRRHNVYILPPAAAYQLPTTTSFLNRREPERSVEIVPGPAVGPARPGDAVLDVQLRARPRW